MLVFYDTHLTSVLAQVADDAEEWRPSGRLSVLGWKLGLARRTIAGLLRRRTAPAA